MKKIFITLLLSVAAAMVAQAQQKSVSGQVVGAEDGEPIPGVSVTIQGTTQGTSTDLDGNYSITVPDEDAVLVFSLLGMVPVEERTGNRTTINVSLEPDTEALEELVVVGYGVQRKADVTGSIASIKGEDIANRATLVATQALQGKAPGLMVTSSTGEPGSTPNVRVRGVGTVGNSNPLYVVDGVFLDNINYLNPGDIESVEVLKDASSLAIYGVRGANGVIIITTKSGTPGKAQVNLNAYTGFTQATNILDMTNAREYAELTAEALRNSAADPDNVVLPPNIADPNALGEGTDWFDLMLRNGRIQNYELSVSGGGEQGTYNISGGYASEEGILIGSKFDRINLRINSDYQVNDALKVGTNMGFTRTVRDVKPRGAITTAYRADPTVVAVDEEGVYGETLSNGGNPLAAVDFTNNLQTNNRLVGSLYGELTFLKDFTFKSNIGADLAYGTGRNFVPEFVVSSQQRNDISRLTKNNDTFVNLLWENTVTYRKNFQNEHDLTLLLGATGQFQKSERFGGTRNYVPGYSEDLWYLDAGFPYEATNENIGDEYAYLSYLFRTNYAFKDRYLLTASMRVDGSSRFPPGERWGVFPAVGLGWRLSEEPFLKSAGVFDNLKLRGSYGALGNQNIPDYLFFPKITAGLNAVFGPNEQLYQGATEVNAFTSNIIWERVKQLDIGLEAGVLNNRLTLEVDYYDRRTEDMIVNLPLPGAGGLIERNAGSVKNSGFEFLLSYENDHQRPFNYSVTANVTTLRNEVTSLGEGGSPIISGGVAGGQTATRTGVGDPIGAFYGYLTDGVYQSQEEIDQGPVYSGVSAPSPGDLRFVDVTGNDTVSNADRTFLGTPIPKVIYGINTSFSYKGVDLAIDIQGAAGHKLYNGKPGVRFSNENFERSRLNRWHGPGTSDTEPRVTNGVPVPSAYFVESGDFVRIRTIQLGYTLPQAVAQRLRIQQARIYVNALNPFTITNYSGFSPEVGGPQSDQQSGGDLSRGLDLNVVPITRNFTIGINIGI